MKKHNVFILLIIFLLISCSNQSWAFEFVSINGTNYVVVDDTISSQDLGEFIGEVEEHSDNEGVKIPVDKIFSNIYEVGTKIYKHETKDTAIVVESQNETLHMAILESEWSKK